MKTVVKICPRCHERLTESADTCYHCGASVDDSCIVSARDADDAGYPEKGRATGRIAYIFGIIGISAFWLCGTALGCSVAALILNAISVEAGGCRHSRSTRTIGIVGIVLNAAAAVAVFIAGYIATH